MSEEEAYKIFSEMTPDVLDYVFCLVKAYTEKDKEIEKLNNIIKHIEEMCKSSIASVDKILQEEKVTKFKDGICLNRNDYQIIRLKAFRTKSKEILGRIKELKGADREWEK